jgi:hypothetical protein
LNQRTAPLGLLVALTIVLASTTVYESGTRMTTTLTSTSTSTSTVTQTATSTTTTTSSLWVAHGFDFITASGNCDGGTAPCWGAPAYVFNCPPSFPSEPDESCSQVVVSQVFPYPVYGLSITSYRNQSEPWANCAYQLGSAGEVGAYCILLNASAFIVGQPAPPPPSTTVTQSSSTVASIQVPLASVSRLDPETSLSLILNLTATANATITVRAYDVNTLASENNLTTRQGWVVPPGSITGMCPNGLVEFVVYQGDYGLGNYTQGTPLRLSQYYLVCTTFTTSYYIFKPLSSEATAYYAPNDMSLTPTQVDASISSSLFGYWVTDSAHPQGAFVLFSPGTYTVAAVDEWGGVALSHFVVQG